MQNSAKRFEDFEPDIRELLCKFITNINIGQTFFDIEELETIIYCFIDMDDMKMARKALEYAYGMYPKEEKWKCREAEILIFEDHYKKALDILESLQEETEVNLYGMKGECYARLKRYKKAKDAFDKYLTLCHPDDLEQAITDIAVIFNEENKPDIALLYSDNGLTLFPDNYELGMEKALALETEERYDEAITEYNRLIDANPYEYKTWGILGSLYFSTDRYAEAEKCFDYVLAINPESYETKVQKANCLYKTGNYIMAVSLYKEVLSKYPDDVLTMLYLAESYECLDIWSEALQLYNKVLEYADIFPEAWIGASSCIINLYNDYKSAIKTLKKGIKVLPEELLLKYHLAKVEMGLGKHSGDLKPLSRALKSIKECLHKMPDNPVFNYDAANIYLQLSMFEKAVKCFELTLTAEDIDFPNIYIFLAIACYGSGNMEKFEKYYLESKKRYSNAEDMFLSIYPEARQIIKKLK